MSNLLKVHSTNESDIEANVDPQNEKRFDYSQRAQWLRGVVLGCNEGIMSSSILVMGMTVTINNTKDLVITSLVGLIAGDLAIATAEFISVYTQVDVVEAQNDRDQRNGAGYFAASLGKAPVLRSCARVLLGGWIEIAIMIGKSTDCHSVVLSSVVDCYSKNGLFLEALEVLRKVKDFGYVVSDYSCNGLLNLLQESNEIGLFWCFYASMLRNGVLVSQFTWSVVARCLSKDGNFEKIGQVIDMGVCNSLMYNLVIEGYNRRGDFGASSHRLSEMVDKKLEPGFGTYSSILDGACQHKYVEMIEVIIDSMVKNGYIPKLPLSEYDSVIQKLSNAGKTYAAELFFDRASDEKVKLNDVTYECMLRAFSREGRVKDAIMIHDKMLERGTVANCSCYTLFLNVLCKEDPTEKISELLKDVIERGFFPSLSELSKYIISQCKNRRWREAEDLLTRILEKGYVPDPFCSSSLIKHYCSSRQIDSAIDLHHRLEHLKGTLDTNAYNVLVRVLLKERRVEEALKIFDYMRTHNLLNGESFSTMISGLCLENDLKKAMKLHDEMLKMGLKPDLKNYKRLISSFR
ncbi:hypothetical protein AgCh_020244 [Apium graveolens]